MGGSARKKVMKLALTFLAALLAAPLAVLHAGEPDTRRFEARVLPVLRKRCYTCHSHEKGIRGGLALDSRRGWEAGGDHGPAIRPGDPGKSLLIQAVRQAGSELRMPPGGKLPPGEIAILEQWVREGAHDPRVATGGRAAPRLDIEAGRKHWAYRPVRDPRPPAVQEAGWARDDLDRFVLARLEQASLRPQPDADRYTWLRRVSLDLTGLPPTQAEINGFVADRSDQAFEKVAERLLRSRAFGERWARHWLDLTGYADQIGTSNNVFAEHAWRYRDYLIESFHTDKPFDRFLREQIAGDLLPYQSPEERAANITATGFLVLGDVEIVNPDKLKMETDLIDQQVSKVGLVFMGQTLGCARCHDHKFDPIGLADYYAVAGMFRSTEATHKIPYGIWSGIHLTDLPETPQQVRERRDREAAHQQRVGRLEAEKALLRKEQTALASRTSGPGAGNDGSAGKRDEIAARLKKLATEIEHAEFFKPTVPKAFAVRDAAQPGDMKICVRGNPYALGASVPRGVVRVAAWGSTPPIPAGQSGRLQLAGWLADNRNPLTARVAVNRIWQKLFGEGLVRSVDYFGIRGERPTHPELLDHLASRFMREGWSHKRLLRALVLSRTYRMGSGPNPAAARVDPDNRLLWRMNRQRLDAEALRDAMLVASGELKSGGGGPSLPLEYVENTGLLQPKGVNPPTFSLNRVRPEQDFQRTIYLPIVRAAQPAPARLRDVFDFTQPAQMAGRRAQTVVPTQALFLLNNELLRRRGAGLATALGETLTDRTARLEALWLRVLNRPITPAELADAGAFLDRLESPPGSAGSPPAGPPAAWLELCHALLSSNEFLFRL